MEHVVENRRLLVIDDDAGVRHAYGEILAPDLDQSRHDELTGLAAGLFGEVVSPRLNTPGFRVTVIPQGEAAAAVAKEARTRGQPYAVAFVDMGMPPGWDGLRTIAELWKHDPHLQTVICTAYSDYSWEEIVARLGRSDRLLILKKPFDRIEVLQLAEALCAKWNLAREEPLAARPTPTARGQPILLVDDNKGVCEFTVTMLADAGYTVTVCASGEEALRHAGTVAFDLLISDVSLPVMGGPELLHRLRERFPNLPAIFITGFADRDVLQGVPVLAKPFSAGELLTVVRQVLGH